MEWEDLEMGLLPPNQTIYVWLMRHIYHRQVTKPTCTCLLLREPDWGPLGGESFGLVGRGERSLITHCSWHARWAEWGSTSQSHLTGAQQ